MDRGAKSCLAFCPCHRHPKEAPDLWSVIPKGSYVFLGGNLKFSKRLWRSRTFTKSQLCLLGF